MAAGTHNVGRDAGHSWRQVAGAADSPARACPGADGLASVSSTAHDDGPLRFRVTAPLDGKRSTDIRWSKRRCVLSLDDDGGAAVTTMEQPTTGPSDKLMGQVLTRPQRRDLTDELLQRMRDCTPPQGSGTSSPTSSVMANLGVADAVVSPHRSRGIPTEDLRQVAYMALVKAAQNFDSTRGYDFLSYTVPTIRGEIRRYFRDHGWMVRPPRRIQDLQRRVSTASAELAPRHRQRADTGPDRRASRGGGDRRPRGDWAGGLLHTGLPRPSGR